MRHPGEKRERGKGHFCVDIRCRGHLGTGEQKKCLPMPPPRMEIPYKKEPIADSFDWTRVIVTPNIGTKNNEQKLVQK